MKHIIAILFVVTALVSGAAHPADRLTNSLAQQALRKWTAYNPEVAGVVDLPGQGVAQVDFRVTNFLYNLPKNDPVTAYAFGPGGGQRTYTGNMVAVFKHYNDGRWVLLHVDGPLGRFSGQNIEVR